METWIYKLYKNCKIFKNKNMSKIFNTLKGSVSLSYNCL